MVTVVTKTVGTGAGRDYPSLASFIAAIPANITAAGTNESWIADIFNDDLGDIIVSSGLSLAGVTSDSTHYVKFRAAVGESFRDQTSPELNPLRYDSSKGVGLTLTAHWSTLISGLSGGYLYLEGIQLKTTHYTQGVYQPGPGSTGVIIINDCIIECFSLSYCIKQFYSTNSEINNSVVINTNTGSSTRAITARGWTIRNTTFLKIGGPSGYVNRVEYGGGNTFENCLFLGFASFTNGVSSGAVYNNCVTDLASWDTGATATSSILNAVPTTEIVGTLADTTNIDARIGASAQSIDAGKDESAFYTTDIINQSWGAVYDSGAFAYVAAGGGSTPYIADLSLSSETIQANNLDILANINYIVDLQNTSEIITANSLDIVNITNSIIALQNASEIISTNPLDIVGLTNYIANLDVTSSNVNTNPLTINAFTNYVADLVTTNVISVAQSIDIISFVNYTADLTVKTLTSTANDLNIAAILNYIVDLDVSADSISGLPLDVIGVIIGSQSVESRTVYIEGSGVIAGKFITDRTIYI